MAINPVSQPMSPGLLEVDYSPWDAAAAARSGAPGGLLGSPAIAPYVSPVFRGGTEYGNYVRDNPALQNLFEAQTTASPTYEPNIAKYGKWFWDKYGSIGGWLPPDPTTVNPNIALADQEDSSVFGRWSGSAGLPMPDVEGYKYVYPTYEWEKVRRGEYGTTGAYEEDIDTYPYYPYYPGDTSSAIYDDKGKLVRKFGVGLRLIKK